MPIKTRHDDQPTLNLTPMIDVVFLLIIFFMVATKFGELEQNIDLQLPEVASAGSDRAPPKPQIIAVFADGHIELDGQQVELADLRNRLVSASTTKPDLSVVVRGDSECQFQHIAGAMGACRDAGISDLGITVRIASAGGSVK